MYTCKSGLHIWTSENDATKCCNGWHRELRLARTTLGETLPADAHVVRHEEGSDVGYVWVRDEDDTLSDEDVLHAMFGDGDEE